MRDILELERKRKVIWDLIYSNHPLPVQVINNIFEFAGQGTGFGKCYKCKTFGQIADMKYIINGDVLWKCTRCYQLFCYYCYEPRDGHSCFDDDWIVGKGYSNIQGVGDFYQYLGPKDEKPSNWNEICSRILNNDEAGYIEAVGAGARSDFLKYIDERVDSDDELD